METYTSMGLFGALGVAVGYATKKLVRLSGLIVGLVVGVALVLSWVGWVAIDWNAVQSSADPLLDAAQDEAVRDSVWNALVANIPDAAGFTTGFLVGLKMG
jgi:uncharacterized membrane protein (Fun14 family)